jgi:hypothetical protein
MDSFRSLDIPAIIIALGIRGEDTGRETVARCPNSGAHSRGDERPSWRIVTDTDDPRYGQHNCFPCGFSGGILSLVAYLRDVSLPGAATWLGIERGGSPDIDEGPDTEWIPWIATDTGSVRESSLDTPELSLPTGTVPIVTRDSWPKWARVYWRLKVGTHPDTAHSWGCAWGHSGRLRNRIVFPARTGGQVISYSARVVDFRPVLREMFPTREFPPEVHEKAPIDERVAELDAWRACLRDSDPCPVIDAAQNWLQHIGNRPPGIRYLTPRERDHASKDWLRAEPGAATRRALFGWDTCFHGDSSAVTLVEGAIKAVRLAAAGWPNPVAMFGVGLTPERAALLRGVETVYYPGDPDAAGRLVFLGKSDRDWKGLCLRNDVESRLTAVIPIKLPDGRPVDRISVKGLSQLWNRHSP